jgi:hypothetical protein
MRLYDHEAMGENNFLDETPVFTIKESPCFVEIALTKKIKERGANLYSDNVFVDIEIMETKAHVVSTQIKVDTNNSIFEIARNITKAKVGVNREARKKEGTCVCKQKENEFYWSSEITCSERKKVLEVSASLWGESRKKEMASQLMSIFHLETGPKDRFKPSADNGKGYSGLIQFNDESAKGLGTTRSKLKAMTFIEQMDIVKKYLEKNKERFPTLTDFYLQVIKPNAVGQGGNPDFVVFDESISVPDGDGRGTSKEQRLKNIVREPWVTKYGYASNPPFMKEQGEHTKREKWVYTKQKKEMRYGFINGKTTIKEITQEVEEQHYNPGKTKIFNGSCINDKSKTPGKRAPWFEVAWEEYEKYKGLREIDSPLKEKITLYFEASSTKGVKNGKGVDYNYSDPWCGAFIAWCFDQTNDYKRINTPMSAAAFGWKPGNWKKGETSKPFVGALIIFSFSHVAIIAGETTDGKGYVYLGGNQGNGEKREGYQKIILGSVSKTSSTIVGITKPSGYVISAEDEKLTKYDISAENTKESSR